LPYLFCVYHFDVQTIISLFICMIITHIRMEESGFPIFQEFSHCGKGSISNIDYFKLSTDEVSKMSEDVLFEDKSSWCNSDTMFFIVLGFLLILMLSLLYDESKHWSIKGKDLVKFSYPKTNEGWYMLTISWQLKRRYLVNVILKKKTLLLFGHKTNMYSFPSFLIKFTSISA